GRNPGGPLRGKLEPRITRKPRLGARPALNREHDVQLRFSKCNREPWMKDELVTVLDQEARRTDAEGKWPDRCMKIVAESGLLGLTMPAEAGGAGAGMREFAEITEKIAAHCASTAMIYL